ncbi:MAG: hypothetical protein ACI4D4_07705 [Lachnospira sp.]
MKKSYVLFVVWLVLLCVLEVGLSILPFSIGTMMRLELNGCSIAIAILTLIIYLTQNVYWYTGISFEEAVTAGRERRCLYALKHLIRFGVFALAFLLYSIVAWILHINCWIDFTIFTVGIVVVAFSTIKIKL